MTNSKTQRIATSFSVLISAMMLASPASHAESFPFRVAFEDVPGVTEITSGNVSEGIEILKQEQNNDGANKGHILATLCGAFIIDSSLAEAAEVCDEAVENYPGETAYNNRGVLRAFAGDFTGARQDFDRARPEEMNEYLEYLSTRDVGLIADDNHGLLQKLVSRHSPIDVQRSAVMTTGAQVETFDD